MRHVRGAVCSLIVGVALCWPGSAGRAQVDRASADFNFAGVDTLTPSEIFNKARDAWAAPQNATTIKYGVTAKGLLADDRAIVRHYAGVYDEGDGSFQVSRFSAEEQVQPATPRGINVELALSLSGTNTTTKRLSRDPEPTDILGFPALSPRYSFGIARSGVDAADKQQKNPNELRVIGRVSIERPPYTVKLLGTELIDDLPAYHLALSPLSDARKYRVREMWVDQHTFETRRIRTDGNFTDKPSVDVPWMVTFKTINHVQYLSCEESEAPMVWKRMRYRQVTIGFDDLAAATSALPTLNLRLPDADGQLSEP